MKKIVGGLVVAAMLGVLMAQVDLTPIDPNVATSAAHQVRQDATILALAAQLQLVAKRVDRLESIGDATLIALVGLLIAQIWAGFRQSRANAQTHLGLDHLHRRVDTELLPAIDGRKKDEVTP